MSNNNQNKASTARQAKHSNNSPSYFEKGSAYLKVGSHYFKQGAMNTVTKINQSMSTNTPHTPLNAAGQAATAVYSARGDFKNAASNFGKAGYNFGMGITQNYSNTYFPNSGLTNTQIATMKIRQDSQKAKQTNQQNAGQTTSNKRADTLKQLKVNNTRAKASQMKQNSRYSPKAKQTNQQKTTRPQKAKKQSNTNSARTGSYANPGISSFKNKTSGRVGSASKGSLGGASKGSSSSSGKSSGSSKSR